MVENEVTVYLNQDEAKKFILFQNYFDTFGILLDAKVFDQRATAITLNIDKQGHIRSIERKDMLYVYGVSFDTNEQSVLN